MTEPSELYTEKQVREAVWAALGHEDDRIPELDMVQIEALRDRVVEYLHENTAPTGLSPDAEAWLIEHVDDEGVVHGGTIKTTPPPAGMHLNQYVRIVPLYRKGTETQRQNDAEPQEGS